MSPSRLHLRGQKLKLPFHFTPSFLPSPPRTELGGGPSPPPQTWSTRVSESFSTLTIISLFHSESQVPPCGL